MEFNEKLQYLRKQNNLTQEQLAEKLYVSRTAISKWESGKGYPNIESLKCISKEFHISIDELLSGNELLELAETENRNNIDRLNGFIYAILDVISVIFMFVPFFGQKDGDYIRAVTLFADPDISMFLRVIYCIALVSMTLFGIVEFIVQRSENNKLLATCRNSSIVIHAIVILIFMLSRQPYISAFLFISVLIKCILFIRKNHMK